MSPKSVVLLSGGLDSVVSFKKALDETRVLLALTFDYHQRSARREIEASRKICERFRVPHRTLELPWLAEIAGGGLVDRKRALPQPHPNDLDNRKVTEKTARAVWISNRNGIFLEIAAAFAESMGGDRVITGFNAEEAETFPDNTKEYCEALTQALAYSTSNHVAVFSYTQQLRKREIVELGVEIAAPLEMIWSCYEGKERMCGSCESCQRAQRAFAEAGYLDRTRHRFETILV